MKQMFQVIEQFIRIFKCCFDVLKTRLVSGVSIGFNKNCFVLDVAKRKRSNNLICVESETHKTSETLVEINRIPYLIRHSGIPHCRDFAEIRGI